MGEINVRVPTEPQAVEPPYQLLPWQVAIQEAFQGSGCT